MAADSRTIVVAGGGIAGMAAALCLAKQGFRVELLEQAEGFESIGAGLQISPNALRVLAWLGLENRMKLVATGPSAIRVLSGRSGKQIVSIPLGETVLRRYGKPYLVAHRADLIQILLQAIGDTPDITIHMTSRVEDASDHAHGVTVLAYSQGEMREYHGAGLVAADGVWSKLRERYFGCPPALHSGITAWRAMVSATQLPGAQDMENTRLYLSGDGHLVCYPVRAGRYLNIVALTRTAGADKQEQNWTAGADISALREKFAGWHREVRDLFDMRGRWTRWPLYTAAVPTQWNRGKAALAGDAAHAMLPFAAQGAAMAIEDAFVLALRLALARDKGEALQDGFAAYSASRIRRVRKAVGLANMNCRIYHLPRPFDTARNMAMMVLGGGMLLSRQNWLYEWQLPDATDTGEGKTKTYRAIASGE